MTDQDAATLPLWIWLLAFFAAAAATYALILWLRPLLQSRAPAHPNARSSHTKPTPQGGGIAVVAVTLASIAPWPLLLQDAIPGATLQITLVGGATLLLAVIGWVDDVRGLATMPRLAMHIVAVAIMLTTLPSELRFIPSLPFSTERALLLLVCVWFINLVNFMDGIDWMTVVEVVPIAAGLAVAGALDALPPLGMLTAIVLAGAMIGFAPFNRPVASLFLGDVGSVPIGLILAWLLLLLAAGGHFAAAMLLPLYYLADATITIGRRLARGEKIWEAHRTHFYQRATDNGWTVRAIVDSVFAVNIALVLLATATIVQPSAIMDAVALVLGAALVGWLLQRFTSPRTSGRPTPT